MFNPLSSRHSKVVICSIWLHSTACLTVLPPHLHQVRDSRPQGQDSCEHRRDTGGLPRRRVRWSIATSAPQHDGRMFYTSWSALAPFVGMPFFRPTYKKARSACSLSPANRTQLSFAPQTKMFSRLAIFSTLSLALLAAATPANVARNGGDSGSATTACCSSTEPVRASRAFADTIVMLTDCV